MKPQTSNSRAAKQPNPSAPQGVKSSAPQDIAGTKPKPGSRAGQPGRASNGHGNGSTTTAHSLGVAKSAATPRLRSARSAGHSAAQAAVTDQPHYDEGLRFDTGLRYAVEDPTLPPAGTAKVKLELNSRTDSNLAAFGESHVEAMTGNLLFPDPVPSSAVFAAALAEFEAVLSALENLRLQTKNLTYQKDQIRKNFEFLFNQRGAYVQQASNANPDAIASAGLMIRNAPTPVGALLPPLGLAVNLTAFHGQLDVRWNKVSGAKSYVVECAEVIDGVDLVWVQVTVGGKLNHLAKDLTPGKHYAFRVASIGGSNGVSQWSPVVQRMAA